MSTTPDNIIKQIEHIQAMVYCARQTVAAEKSHECDMAASLLRQADNGLFALKEAIDDPGPVMDPKMDGGTILDTLSYAQQDNADPDRVLLELIQVIKPYCQSRDTREKLPDLLLAAGRVGA